jgi:hypothetical protein
MAYFKLLLSFFSHCSQLSGYSRYIISCIGGLLYTQYNSPNFVKSMIHLYELRRISWRGFMHRDKCILNGSSISWRGFVQRDKCILNGSSISWRGFMHRDECFGSSIPRLNVLKLQGRNFLFIFWGPWWTSTSSLHAARTPCRIRWMSQKVTSEKELPWCSSSTHDPLI